LRFSQNRFFHEKSSESPPFLSTGTSDRAEIFFTDTRDILGWVFFFFEKYCTIDVWQTLQKNLSLKNMHFLRGAQYFDFFFGTERDRKKKKKYPSQMVSSTCKKSFSSIGCTGAEKRGRKGEPVFDH
jgi:hypothetical protein